MIKLFQTGSINRLTYFLVLICLVGFDLSKKPIQNFLQQTNQGIQSQIRESRGKELRSTFNDIARLTDNTISAEERNRRAAKTTASVDVGQAIAIGAAMQVETAAVGTVYVSILIAMGFASYVLLIWMVFARIRNIGWSYQIGFAVLALPLFVRLFGADVPLFVFYAAQGAFALALIGLALPPTGFGDPSLRSQASASPRAAAPGQFGRRI